MSHAAAAEWYSDEQEKMGTRVEVQLWLEDEAAAQRLLVAAMAEFDRIELMMSTYIATSEMSRINALAATEAQQVSPELFSLIELAMSVSAMSGGAFDISFDSVGVLYDFRERQRPDADDIAAQISTIDYKLIELNEADQSIRFKELGVRINLGGIAKGYAVEKVIELLEAGGVKNALATAGGDTRLLGDRRDKPWIVGIQDPSKSSAIFTRLALEDEAISTSGDYERFFMEDGKRYHHILRPADGKPVEGVRSVTVIGPDATMTDGLSTTVFVMGPEAGLKLIGKLPGYEAVVITNDALFYSEGLNPG